MNNGLTFFQKKLLKLWFSDEFKRSDWSCFSSLKEIAQELGRYRYPSTTSRTPRSFLQFHRFKANELRLILLNGAPVFKRFLKPIYFKNYLSLVIAIHMAESRSIAPDDVAAIEFLLRKNIKTASQVIFLMNYLLQNHFYVNIHYCTRIGTTSR